MSTNRIPAIVTALRLEAEHILSLELRPVEDKDFPGYTPGAHIDLHLPNQLVRSYSLLRPALDDRSYTIGVLLDRNSRGGSRFIHTELRPGAVLEISAPRNNFALVESAPRSVLLAGGIGITPMLCMLHRLVALGRDVTLIYCARARKESAFHDELDQLAARGVKMQRHFDDEQGGPPDLALLLQGYTAETHFYCCGPERMLTRFEQACQSHDYNHVHIERFAAVERTVPPLEMQGAKCSVELRKSGKSFDIDQGVPLLDAILAAGVNREFSCREGLCGACETTILEGQAIHQDSILTSKEQQANKTMMVCVSGSKTHRLVLDL